MLVKRLLRPLALASLAPTSLLLAASLPPAGWDWPATGQLLVTCVVETNANGLVSGVISLDPSRSTLGLPPAQLTTRCRPGSQTWSGPQAWDLPVVSIGAWRLQVLDGQGTVLSDTSGGPLRVPATNLWTAGLPQGPTQGPVTVDALPLALAVMDFTPAELKPLVLDYLGAHPTSLPVTGEVKFHVLIPSGATVQVAQDVTVEALIVQAGAAVEGGDGRQVTVQTLLDNHGTISGVVEPRVDWLQTTLDDGSSPGDRTARTDAHFHNWYNDYELTRAEPLRYSTLLEISPSMLPPMVEDRPQRWLRRVPDTGSPVPQPTIMLLAGQFGGDMPGTYWARWGRYAKYAESENEPGRLRLDPDTHFITRAITNLQMHGQFVDGTVATKFVGTLESAGSIEVENPLEIRGALVNHASLSIRRALIAQNEDPAQNHYNTGWLRLRGPALSALGGTITLEHPSASLEFGDQTKAVAENLLIRGSGTLNLRFLDGQVRLGEPGSGFTLLGELDHGQMRIGPAVQIQLTEGGFYNGGVIELTGADARMTSPGWLGANNHDMRTTLAGPGRLEVREGAWLELIAGFHAPDYWRRWSVVVENDLVLGPTGTLHTAPYTGVGSSSDSPVEIQGALASQGRMLLERSLVSSGGMTNSGRIQLKGVELLFSGGATAVLGGSLELEQASLRTADNAAIAVNDLRVTGTGAFNARLRSGTTTLEGTNSSFTLTPRLEADARLLVTAGLQCLVPEAGLLNDGLIEFSGAGTRLWTPNWLGAPNHDMRTVLAGRGKLRVRDGAVLELTAGYHRPDYWRQWSVVIENDVVVGPGGTLHTTPYTGGSDDSPVEIRGTLLNQGRILLQRTLLVGGEVYNSGRLQLDAPLTTPGRLVNSGELVLNAPLSSPDLLSEGGSIVASQLTVRANQRLAGNATITGDLLNEGLVSPGQSPGLIEITGNYRQTGGLVAEVRGAADAAFDRLAVRGQVQLAGRLQVRLLPGADFPAGTTFDIIRGAAVSGTFDATLMARANGVPLFELSYGPDYVRLTALQPAPPPPSLAIPPQNLADVIAQGLRLHVSNLANGPFTVEFSRDLQHWDPVLTFPEGDLPTEFLVPPATNRSTGFYRGVQPP